MFKIVAIFLFILSACNGNIESKKAVFIYHGSSDGDKYIASRLEDGVKNKNIHIYNAKSIEEIERNVNFYSKKYLYVIGQSACNDAIKMSLRYYHEVSLYTDVVDDNILDFVKNYNGSGILNLFINERQSLKLPFNISNKVKIHTSYGIIPVFNLKSYATKKDFYDNKKSIKGILDKKTFVIGGNFVDASFKKVIVPISSYVDLVRRNLNAKEYGISIVLNSRFFDECDNLKCKISKIKSLKNDISKNNVNSVVYIPKNIYNSSLEFSNICRISPSIPSILYGIYNLKSKNIVIYTFDQFDIMSVDNGGKLFGDYLIENPDQMSIYQSTKSGKRLLMNKILYHINQIK